ncbi:MAG TPA: hypothetical protein VEA36_02560 [Candidatus Paceibacterota bacterium]|nr:hypothetical protein [Candidatus Paceibacterota bacterium]
MNSFNAFNRAPKEELKTRANPVEANDNDAASKGEAGPDPVLVEANVALRGIVNDLGAIEKPADRVPVFQRMFNGPEVVTDNPALIPFFDRIAVIEGKYGREAVKEIATLYGADRMSDAAP